MFAAVLLNNAFGSPSAANTAHLTVTSTSGEILEHLVFHRSVKITLQKTLKDSF